MIGIKGLAPGTAREVHGGSEDIGTCRGGAKTPKLSQYFHTGGLAYMNVENMIATGDTLGAVDAAIRTATAAAAVTRTAENEIAAVETMKAVDAAIDTANAALVVMRTISVQSAGACAGSYFKVWVDGVEVQNDPDHPGWNRGINAIVIDVSEGKAISRHNFDTCCASSNKPEMTTDGENQRLQDFVEGLAEGQLVVFGIIDEGMNRLSDDSKASLGKMGSALLRAGQVGYRESWSMIGIKRSFLNEEADAATQIGHAFEHHGGAEDQADCGGGPATLKMSQTFMCVGDFCSGNVVG
jgi:hypothetical protein